MSSMTVEMGKRYRTQKGHRVRILATDAEGQYPVVALVADQEKCERVIRYTEDGRCPQGGAFRLVEDDEITLEGWVNIYSERTLSEIRVHDSKRRANEWADRGRIACVPITVTFKGGEGLDD